MRKLLFITGRHGPTPDFGFLCSFGFEVTYMADTSPELPTSLGDHDIVVLACETRGTQHARIWNYERELFLYVRSGGRLLFCAPAIGAWSMVWNVYPALLPVTPFMRSAVAENFPERFRWDSAWDMAHQTRVVPVSHPVCEGISEWPEFYEGSKPGSYNAYDFDRWAPKPHTDIAIRTEDGGVALAFMEAGRGRTGFLLADIHDDGGQAWRNWPDHERFWIALLKHLDAGDLRIERSPEGVVPFAPRIPLLPRPRFEWRPSPASGNPDWARTLTRNDWVMMSDNQITVNPSATPILREPALYGDGWSREVRAELGIGHVKFYPTVVQFESALSADVFVGGELVEMHPVPDAYQWQPHLVSNRLQSSDGTVVVEKRMTIVDDVVSVELRVTRGAVDQLRLRGFNRYHGFLQAQEDRLLGQVESGVVFGVSATAPVRWRTCEERPLKYEGELTCGKSVAIFFTAAMEVDVVNARLDAIAQNPEAVFANAFQQWNAYFREQVPAFRSDDPEIERLIYGAFLGFRLNLYDVPYEPWCSPHSCPSKMHFDPQWEQDDVQAATIGKWLRDPTLSERQILRPFRVGFVLNNNAAYGPVDRQTRGLIGELQQYSLPMREAYLFDPRPELRREMIEAMLREENENNRWTPVEPSSGLFSIFNCLGMDDSPRWDSVSPGKKAEWFQSFERGMVTPDVNATIAHRASFLAELLQESGDVRAADFSTLAAKRKTAIREHLWSTAVGIFVDHIAGESAVSDVVTPMAFTPLLLGPFDEEVNTGVKNALYAEEIFGTPYGLPTVARSHPKFDPMSYWRGSIWSRTNWFATEALYAGGLKQDAAALTRRWMGLVLKDGVDLRENFNPLTGEEKCATMFTEGLSGMADTYLKNVAGFRATWRGFDLDPIALDVETPSFTFGPFRYRGRDITISWDRRKGCGELHLDGRLEHWSPGVYRQFEVPPLAAM